MNTRCTLCRESQASGACMPLAEISYKFENLMEATEFDETLINHASICKNCNTLLCNFFDFKAAFMEKQDGLLNGKSPGKRVNLHEVLVARGVLKSTLNFVTLKICRTCLKPERKDDCKEIRSPSNGFAHIIGTCLPAFDFFLTGKIFICRECQDNVRKYHRFLILCMEAMKAIRLTADSTDHFSRRIEQPPSQEPLIPIATEIEPFKKGRGRPRKQNLQNPPRKKETTPRKECISTLEEIEKRLTESRVEKCSVSYECQVCPAVYDTFKGLLEHIRFHEKQTQLTCWKCGVSVCSLRALRTHFGSHGLEIFKMVAEEKEESTVPDSEHPKLSQKPKKRVNISRNIKRKTWILLLPEDTGETDQHIECQLCLEKIRSFRLFQKHIEDHTKVREFHCLKCLFICHVINDLQIHMKNKHGIPNLYRICAPEKNNQNTVTSESESHASTASGQYCCGHCSTFFNSLGELDGHACQVKLDESENEDAISPDTPKKVDITLSNSQTNQCSTKSPENQFLCFLCGQAFKTDSDLATHVCNVPDPEENPFQCTYCSAAFDTLNDLNKHRDDCQINNFVKVESRYYDDSVEPEENLSGKKTKPTAMEIINKIANSLGVKILEDAETDVGEKTFDCVGCDFKTTTEKDSLIHLNYCEKVKKCHRCPYTTNVAQKLEVHCYFMHDILLFVCSRCRFVTATEKNFKAHMHSHTEEVSQHKQDVLNKEIEINQPVWLIESTPLEKNFLPVDDPAIEQNLLPDKTIIDPLFITDNPIDEDQEVIDIESDSDNEFVESVDDRINNSSTIVEAITDLDPLMASQLISQGVPVVNESSLRLETKPVQAETSASAREVEDSVVISDDENEESIGMDEDSLIQANASESTNKRKSGQNSDKPNKKLKTIKTMVKNNYIIIYDDEIDNEQTIIESDDDDYDDDDDDDDVIEQLETQKSETTQESSEAETKIKRRYTGYLFFCKKVGEQIKNEYPQLSRKEQREMILNSWRGMSDKEKWPFIEEARLNYLLAKREQPELFS